MQLDMQFQTALSALRVAENTDYIDMPKEQLDFLMGNRPWLAADRNRAKVAVEAIAYGACDLVGFARFDLPAEFVAAVIQKFVSPVNWQVACGCMAGIEDTTSIIQDRNNRLHPSKLFAMVLRIDAGHKMLDGVETNVKAKTAKVAAE